MADRQSTPLTADELEAEGATALPDKEVLSLLDLNADLDLALDAAAPGDVPAGADVPARADGLELFGEIGGSGYRKAPSLVRRGDGQTVQLTKLLYLVVENVDGERDCEAIATNVSEAYGRLVSAEDGRRLIHTKLRPLGLLRKADGSQPEVKKSNTDVLACRGRA